MRLSTRKNREKVLFTAGPVILTIEIGFFQEFLMKTFVHTI